MSTNPQLWFPGLRPRRPQEGANVVDRTGKRYGRVIVLRRHGSRGTDATWLCLCNCGREKVLRSSVLRNYPETISCGCARRTGKNSRPLYKTDRPPGLSARNALWRHYIRAAQKRELAWELTNEAFDLLIKGACLYCGCPPSTITRVSRNGGELVWNGIDRVDNMQGYIPGNVVSCCAVCNHAKHTMPQEAFFAWIDRLVQHRLSTLYAEAANDSDVARLTKLP